MYCKKVLKAITSVDKPIIVIKPFVGGRTKYEETFECVFTVVDVDAFMVSVWSINGVNNALPDYFSKI